jgi:hypothetical protein
MKKQQSKQTSRRKFLRDSAVVSAGAAIAASSPASAIKLTEEEKVENKASGYRVTDHIAAYYKTAAE